MVILRQSSVCMRSAISLLLSSDLVTSHGLGFQFVIKNYNRQGNGIFNAMYCILVAIADRGTEPTLTRKYG